MSAITRTSPSSSATAIAIVRIVTGAVFFAHGYQKLFVFGPAGVAQAFAGMHIPLPAITSILIAAIELLGGIALILGFGTRIAAALLACDMVGAILLVHGRNGFFLPSGFEFAFTLLAASVALLIAGAGAASVEALIDRRAA